MTLINHVHCWNGKPDDASYELLTEARGFHGVGRRALFLPTSHRSTDGTKVTPCYAHADIDDYQAMRPGILSPRFRFLFFMHATIAKFEQPGVYEVGRTFTPRLRAELNRLRVCPACGSRDVARWALGRHILAAPFVWACPQWFHHRFSLPTIPQRTGQRISRIRLADNDFTLARARLLQLRTFFGVG